jgi:hypothetical protein
MLIIFKVSSANSAGADASASSGFTKSNDAAANALSTAFLLRDTKETALSVVAVTSSSSSSSFLFIAFVRTEEEEEEEDKEDRCIFLEDEVDLTVVVDVKATLLADAIIFLFFAVIVSE